MVAPRVRKIGADGNEKSNDDDSGREDDGYIVDETGGGGVAANKKMNETIIGKDEKEESNEESDENFYEVEEFVWQHKSQKVGKLFVTWNTGKQEYATVKPVLLDLPEDTLSFIWRVFSKTPSVIAYIDKVAK